MNKETATLLEEHFDTAFAAPDGVAKLRELILTLAMQGRLVEQDPNDLPASELLKEIEAEKQRLIKEKKIKKPKPLPPIKPEETPYELPKGWEWMRLGEIFRVTSGKNLPKNKMQDGDIPVFGGNGITGYHNESNVNKPTVVVGRVGYYCGSIHLTPAKAWITDNAFFTFYDEERLFQGFVIWLLKTINLQINTSATAQPVISGSKIYPILIPLSPLPEQHRIVIRIDQLMARCAALEKLRKEQEEKRLAVHAAAIRGLLDASDGSAWNFIRQHFSELYTVKENVAELRKAILQLAVMGRLVPQDSNDPPASELLKEIKAEKQRLIKEKKIKKTKPLPPIKPEDVPYELPQGWEWVKLGELAEIIGGFAYKSSLFKSEGKNQVLRLGNIRPDHLRLAKNPVFIDDDIAESTRGYRLANGDILITMTGTREKRDYLYSVRIEGNPINGKLLFLNQRVGAIRPFLNSEFLNKVIKVENFKDTIYETSTGSANQANIGINTLREWSLPLPPLKEQSRIVTRIDQLMVLCDKLEQQIDTATNKQSKLLNAVMAQI